MKYLVRFNESESPKFDVDFAMSKIKEHFSEDEVISSFDDEVLNWVDDDWNNDGEYDGEYDWYVDHNNGEAQDVIITNIINWFKKEFNMSLSIEEYSELHDAIKQEYDCLRY